jgi:nitrate reductase delta subunit
MLIYKLLSLLLEYPSRELHNHFEEMVEQVRSLPDIPLADTKILETFISWARSLSLLEHQQEYVRTFDLSPDNALYFTHHLFEEQDRERGPTLVELSEFFTSEGFEITGSELPDYLPLVLEYVSTLSDKASACLFLRDSAQVCEKIANNLESMNSPYAPLLRIIERHGRLTEIAA